MLRLFFCEIGICGDPINTCFRRSNDLCTKNVMVVADVNFENLKTAIVFSVGASVTPYGRPFYGVMLNGRGYFTSS